MPVSTLEPGDARTAAAALADAGRQGLTVVACGSGTKAAWGNPPATDALSLSTRHLSTPIQHFAGDLVATIPAGATLANANAVLAASGQWLPLDPAFADCATVGGIVATNDSGPRRHKHGSPRDLIIGVEIALCDGRVAKAGGRVVKNVAGYDLSRLMCGSFGSLAVITSATFKLAPLTPASVTVVVKCGDVTQAARLAAQVAEQPVTPSALEIAAPSTSLLIRFETTERAAEQMATATGDLLHRDGASTEFLRGQAERDVWTRHESSIWDRPGLVAKVSVMPTDVGPVLAFASELDSRLDWSAVGRAALGVMLVRLNVTGSDQTQILTRLRQHVMAKRGTLVILRGANAAELPATSHIEPALKTVMNAIKARFDPMGVLPAIP